jgi:hypothetical protein
LRRLSQAGFSKEFVRLAILPDWWEDACAERPELLPDVELRIARFLGLSLAAVRDPISKLTPPNYANAQLRRVRDIDRDRIAPAIHSGFRIGAAVLRSLIDKRESTTDLPSEGLAWRKQLCVSGGRVTLDRLLADLWRRGIPVIPIEVLPVPSFQGMVGFVEGRPVILLGHKHDEPGRVGFFIAHEFGHIALRHCAPDIPVVDDVDEGNKDDGDVECVTDTYATQVLVGANDVPSIDGKDFKDLARNAIREEGRTNADAGSMIFAWAAKTRDYGTASLAVKALYRGSGARRLMRKHFDDHVDLTSAAESDRALLRCVFGDPEGDDITD